MTISFTQALVNYPEFWPILIGLMLVSTYLVLNFGIIFKVKRKRLFNIIDGKEHLNWYLLRSFLSIGLSPTIHSFTIFYLSGSRTIEDLSLISLAPDFIIFQVVITLYLALIVAIGYHFPIHYIKRVSFHPSTFFTLTYSKKGLWPSMRSIAKILCAMSLISIALLPIFLLI